MISSPFLCYLAQELKTITFERQYQYSMYVTGFTQTQVCELKRSGTTRPSLPFPFDLMSFQVYISLSVLYTASDQNLELRKVWECLIPLTGSELLKEKVAYRVGRDSISFQK